MILPIQQICAGMTVSADVYTKDGTKLVSKGTTLTRQHIERLKSHRIQFVDIDRGQQPSAVVLPRKAVPVAPIRRPAPPPEQTEKELRAVLGKIPLFSGFQEEQLSFIIRNSVRTRHQAQTVLFHENDRGDSFLVILRGAVKIFIRNPKGEEKILSLLKDGDSFGELSLIDGDPRSASAQTLEETDLLQFSRIKFYDLIRAHPELSQTIMIELSKRLRNANNQISDLVFYNARHRILKNLLLLATRFGKRKHDDDTIYVRMPLNLKELAQMAVVKQSELEETIRDLEERRILKMQDNSFEIILAKLR